MRDRMPGTIWRLTTQFVLVVVVVAIVYTLVSVGIAITTADKCGDLKADKHWQFVPPQWECGN
jgi:hypothetical protein